MFNCDDEHTGGGGGGRNFMVMNAFQGGFGGAAAAAAFPSPSNFSHYAIQQGIPYNLYGYVSLIT